jgi:hypothetical protein
MEYLASLRRAHGLNDTSPEMAERFRRVLRERSGSDRVRIVSDMFEMARALVTASVKAQRPEISDADLRGEVFRRFYASDFTPEDLASIVDRLKAASE